MLQLALGQIIQADREREIEAAIRRRRLLEPHELTEPAPVEPRSTSQTRKLASRTRVTEG